MTLTISQICAVGSAVMAMCVKTLGNLKLGTAFSGLVTVAQSSQKAR